jgi:hypothetical protein
MKTIDLFVRCLGLKSSFASWRKRQPKPPFKSKFRLHVDVGRLTQMGRPYVFNNRNTEPVTQATCDFAVPKIRVELSIAH